MSNSLLPNDKNKITFLPNSAEQINESINLVGVREKIDQAFLELSPELKKVQKGGEGMNSE